MKAYRRLALTLPSPASGRGESAVNCVLSRDRLGIHDPQIVPVERHELAFLLFPLSRLRERAGVRARLWKRIAGLPSPYPLPQAGEGKSASAARFNGDGLRIHDPQIVPVERHELAFLLFPLSRLRERAGVRARL